MTMDQCMLASGLSLFAAFLAMVYGEVMFRGRR